jgi:hypothetical protein
MSRPSESRRLIDRVIPNLAEPFTFREVIAAAKEIKPDLFLGNNTTSVTLMDYARRGYLRIVRRGRSGGTSEPSQYARANAIPQKQERVVEPETEATPSPEVPEQPTVPKYDLGTPSRFELAWREFRAQMETPDTTD